METGTYISKSTAGSVIGVLLVGMCAASGYALRDGAPMAAASTIPNAALTISASDTLEIDPSAATADKPAVGADADRKPKDRRTTQFLAAGMASFYGYQFEGRPTANGESFDPRRLTAAHQSLPFGTRVRVTNVANGRTVDVRINDRGPFTKGRIIDVSRGAAEKLGMVRSGTAKVTLELIH